MWAILSKDVNSLLQQIVDMEVQPNIFLNTANLRNYTSKKVNHLNISISYQSSVQIVVEPVTGFQEGTDLAERCWSLYHSTVNIGVVG